MRDLPMFRMFAAALAASALLVGCGDETSPATPPTADRSGPYIAEPWPLPPRVASAQPDLSASPDGRLLLTWIAQQKGRRPALQLAELYPDGRWDGPRTVVVGNAMFVNWADTPHIAATADRALWVHWLQKSADAPYAYDVMLARSLDHGMNWSAPVRVHEDATQTEHGFVSFWAQSDSTLGVAWLDGRNTGDAGGQAADTLNSGEHEEGTQDERAGHGRSDHAIGDPMTLRATVFDAMFGQRSTAEIDASVCDCCQTDVATTPDSALLVYRDRSEDEIRDIYISKFNGVNWSKPRPVHADGWKMPACPVNGPSIAAEEENVAVGWYTAAGDDAQVKLARSSDGGDHFSAPLVVDRGAAVLGRVAVEAEPDQIWIAWMREEAGAQSLWLARYAPDLSREIQRIELAKLQGRGRATGFPKLALRQGVLHAVWTDVIDGEPRLSGATLRPAD